MQSLIFFGSDQYSAIVLSSLINTDLRENGLTDLLIVTDPHTPPSPVEILANNHNLNVLYYPTNKDEMNNFVLHLSSSFSHLESTLSPLGLCASFDHLLPKNIIELFAGNLYNLHPSILPQYRNVSPVQYAIALGDKITGITLFRISPGIDDGEIIAHASEDIQPTDTTPTLTSRLFTLGAELFITATKTNFARTGTLENGITGELVFTHRLTRASGFIEWNVLFSLLNNTRVEPDSTTNELLRLRLSREEKNTSHLQSKSCVLDLAHALNPWPGIWSLVPSKKGELRISLTPDLNILIAGKPKPISLSDFQKYYC